MTPDPGGKELQETGTDLVCFLEERKTEESFYMCAKSFFLALRRLWNFAALLDSPISDFTDTSFHY